MTLTSRSPLLSPTITSSEASDHFHQSLIKLRTFYSLMHLSVSVCAFVHYLLSLLQVKPQAWHSVGAT